MVVLSSGALLIGILTCIEIGFRLGRRRTRDPDAMTRGLGGMEAAVFGLLGLMLAFVFGGAANRFETRRELIVQESNAIGTAYLRLDLLHPEDRQSLRKLLRDWTAERIAFHREVRDGQDDQPHIARLHTLQTRIWTGSQQALTRADSAPATQLIVPALNEMFDIASTRIAATRIHAPLTIVALLFVIVLLGSTLAGFSMSARLVRARLHMLVFAAAMTITVYITLDMELPRAGIIRVDDLDSLLGQMLKSM